METECRHDCEYYSNYTDTCDYTLLMYESRGCPIDACTKYKPRTRDRRAWSIFRPAPGGAGFSGAAGEAPMPEPPVEACGTQCVTAACGHEVYDGELVYEWEDGGTLCPECLEDKFAELSTAEKAALIGCDFAPVRFPRRSM